MPESHQRVPLLRDEHWLAELLASEPIPSSIGAEQRTIAALRASAGGRVVTRRGARLWAVIPRSARATALAACAAVVVVGASLTPPGRAAAEALGELVGVGDAPTIDHTELLERRFEPGVDPTGLPGTPQGPEVVVGTGAAPGGARFEVVAYRTDAIAPSTEEIRAGQANEISTTPGLAVAVDFPASDGRPARDGSISFGPVDALGTAVEPEYGFDASGAIGLGAEGTMITGDAPVEASRVEVTYTSPVNGETEVAPSQTFRVDGELLQRIGIDTPFSYWVAFAPEAVGGAGPLAPMTGAPEVRVYDAEGNEISASQVAEAAR